MQWWRGWVQHHVVTVITYELVVLNCVIGWLCCVSTQFLSLRFPMITNQQQQYFDCQIVFIKDNYVFVIFQFFLFLFHYLPFHQNSQILAATFSSEIACYVNNIFYSSWSFNDGVDALHGGCPCLFGLRCESRTKIGSQEINQHFGQILSQFNQILFLKY